MGLKLPKFNTHYEVSVSIIYPNFSFYCLFFFSDHFGLGGFNGFIDAFWGLDCNSSLSIKKFWEKMSVVIISNALALFLYNMEVIATEFWNSITHYAIFVWSCWDAALHDLLQPINWFNYTAIRQQMKVSSSSLKGQT